MDFLEKKVVPSGRVQKLDFRTFGDIIKMALASPKQPAKWERFAARMLVQKLGSGSSKGKAKR